MIRRYLWSIMLIAFLSLLVACGKSEGSGGTATIAPQQVHVSETDFYIASSTTSFHAGRPYHFVVTNKGHMAHEFMIVRSSLGNMGEMRMEQMDAMSLLTIDQIAPGEVKTVDYTFPLSTVGSHPEFACDYPGHYESGMKQEVTVTS